MNTLKRRAIRRAAYLVALLVMVLSGCGIGRYNNQLTAMKWPENTTYYYNGTGQYIGSSVNQK